MSKKLNVTVHCDEENQTCVAYVKKPFDDFLGLEITCAKAITRCAEGDEFDPEFGKKLVKAKAIMRARIYEQNVLEAQLEEVEKEMQKVKAKLAKAQENTGKAMGYYYNLLAEKYPDED